MANIADNLKRLLGTEGHNIQEVLENADSIGGGGISSLPYIEFVATLGEVEGDFAWSIGEIRNIDNIFDYIGPCFICRKYPSYYAYDSVLALGYANPEDDTFCQYFCVTFEDSGINCFAFAIANDAVTLNEHFIPWTTN